MNTPAYYDTVPSITMTDPLAETLGSAEGGTLEYRYLDAVKLTGHSCPTVAGAWRLTRDALARLYPQGTPRRGEIRVDLREALDDGVAGVIASVVSLVTGAAMLWLAVDVYRLRRGIAAARALRRLFAFSILYLFVLFAVLLGEVVFHAIASLVR